jgi:uncharacterized membrane protein YbhN (UPF0104 family)
MKKKEEKKEIGGGGGGAQASFLVFSLLFDNPKDFIMAAINVWGLVVGALIMRAFNTRRY